jgi:hypothetical protein
VAVVLLFGVHVPGPVDEFLHDVTAVLEPLTVEATR